MRWYGGLSVLEGQTPNRMLTLSLFSAGKGEKIA